MRASIVSYLEDFVRRGKETAVAYRRGLRTHRWSYGRLAATAFQFARELAVREVNKGDRVLIWGENSAEWIVAFFGCLLRGAIAVPLDIASEPDFVARVHKQVEAKLLLRDSRNQLSGKLNLPEINLDELNSLVARHATQPYSGNKSGADDTVEIVFTSGTTAEPRGVRITNRNLLANLSPLEEEIQAYLKWEHLVHPIRFLCALPLSHVFGQFMGIFVPQLIGGEVFFIDSLKPSEMMETIRRERISVLSTVPRVLDTLREKIEMEQEARGRLEVFRAKLKASAGSHFIRRWWAFRDVHRSFGWKFWALVSGGAALSAETEQLWQRLGFAVLQGYGMTETASLISVNHPFEIGRGSVGRVLPGQEVRLDESGEILVRGPNISPGYWNEGAAGFDEEGWFHTGDLGEMDEEGNLYFKSRKKEVIVTAAGMNVYPEDIEAVLNEQPEVRTSAVVPIDGPRGPEPLAVLILREGAGRDAGGPPAAMRALPGALPGAFPEAPADGELAARVIKRANKSLAEHQEIRRWVIWPEEDFPRTATQKIRRQLVAEKVRGQIADETAPPDSGTELAKLVRRVSGEAPARLDLSANLSTDLKLDSLGRVELLSALEDRYQMEINEAQMTEATTLGDIEEMIRRGALQGAAKYPYPKLHHRFPFTVIRTALYYLIILPFTRLLCPMTVSGREHLRGARGPLLFVANHVTMVDHALVLAALPARFRHRMAIAMDGELLRDWLHAPAGTGWFTRLRLIGQYWLVVTFFNVFPMPQHSGFRRSFRFAGEMVDRGYSIMVFPEGRRTEHGRLNPFLAGSGLLARNLEVPAAPMRIDGLFALKEKGRHHARRGEVSVRIGAPVSFDSSAGPEVIAAELQERVAAA